MDNDFDSTLSLPPALQAHRWGRVYPEHIQAALDRFQKLLYSISSETQAATEGILLEIERAYTKGYQDGLAASAALAAQEQNGG